MKNLTTNEKNLPAVFGVMIVVIAALAAGCKEGNPKITVTLPQDEATFVRIVSAAQGEAQSAQNDMQVGGVKSKRDRALCDSGMSYVVNDWVGKIERIDSNSDGKGVLSVSIAPDILVKTWNNDLSDLVDGTLIQPGTPLFEAASAMSPSEYVTFSGLLFRGSDGDCAKEASLTLRGKVMKPEFIFRFDKIARYAPQTAKASANTSTATEKASAQAVAPEIAAPVAAPVNTSAAQEPAADQEQVVEPVVEPPVASVPPSTSSAPPRVVGPSFDCAKAGSVIEQLICKDETLAQLDAQLARAYRAAAGQVPDKVRLKSEQLAWLKNRRNKCATAECVFAAYEERLAALHN